MYPEDRVLVAYLKSPADFVRARDDGWYRIPFDSAPKGLQAEYYAFYFGRRFGPEKWSVRYFARNRGHELVSRRQLLPEQPIHPRAERAYYKIQLGPLLRRSRPIISLRWRRVTFIHTTWDRFEQAVEIRDLTGSGPDLVNRQVALLRERPCRRPACR